MVKEYLNYAGLKTYDEKIKAWVIAHIPEVADQYDDTEVRQLISNLQQLVGNESVDSKIATAIANVIDSAPENFDTLKEIAEWINTHGEAAAALIESVASLGKQINEVETKVDAIGSISSISIEALFYEPVILQEGQTVQEAIDVLEPEQKLVLDEDVAEDLVINKNTVIEAEGVTFSGKITVDKEVDVTIIGATFSGEVVVQ